MENIISMEFVHGTEFYYALVRLKVKDGIRRYFNTIVNKSFKTLPHGNSMIIEENGVLKTRFSNRDTKAGPLVRGIVSSVCDELQSNCLLSKWEEYSRLN